MIDLHTHTLLSDGELLPTELARRARDKGYCAIGITDHADSSNLETVIGSLKKACDDLGDTMGIRIVCGVELTHIPPSLIPGMVKKARALGARLILVHGETLVEPVASGTNLAALQSDIDVLTHPGLISDEEAKLAAERGICLEITSRSGHSYSNGHVAAAGRKAGARLILNSDSHSPGDLLTADFAGKIVCGAGLPRGYHAQMLDNSKWLLNKIGVKI